MTSPDARESSQQPTTPEAGIPLYEPSTSLPDTLAKIDGLLAKPADEVTNRDLFEAIADSFATRCTQYKDQGIKWIDPETGAEDDVDWEREDEKAFYFEGDRRVGISYDRDTHEQAWIDLPEAPVIVFMPVRDDTLIVLEDYSSQEPGGEVPSRQVASLGAAINTNVLETLAMGLKSPLGPI